MARQARIVLPGVAHHVTQRGSNQQDVFFTNDDRSVYLSYLKESGEQYGLTVSAYCLMTNQIHLVATPEREESLAKALGRAHLMYAQYIHRARGGFGHFWQNRFYSCPLDENHAHNAVAYIELNPVRAGLVTRPWEYTWSSAAAHCGDGGDPSGLLTLSAWFERIPAKEWRATLMTIAKLDEPVEQLRLHTQTGRPLGDDTFLNRIEALVGRRVRPLPVGRPKGWRKTP